MLYKVLSITVCMAQEISLPMIESCYIGDNSVRNKKILEQNRKEIVKIIEKRKTRN